MRREKSPSATATSPVRKMRAPSSVSVSMTVSTVDQLRPTSEMTPTRYPSALTTQSPTAMS